MKSGKRHMTEGMEVLNKKKKKQKTERSGKRKPENAWEYWKLTLSNKSRWKKKLKRVPQEKEKATWSQII